MKLLFIFPFLASCVTTDMRPALDVPEEKKCPQTAFFLPPGEEAYNEQDMTAVKLALEGCNRRGRECLIIFTKKSEGNYYAVCGDKI